MGAAFVFCRAGADGFITRPLNGKVFVSDGGPAFQKALLVLIARWNAVVSVTGVCCCVRLLGGLCWVDIGNQWVKTRLDQVSWLTLSRYLIESVRYKKL